VVSLLGFAGVIAARYSLGRSFSVVAKATDLVTTGVYSRIRNPIYVFSWFFIIGMVTMVRVPILYLFPVILIPVQIARARNEARVLEAKFGDEYRRYRASTWF
jgi:protein-S-isoprenylcysteine O-methyltransferase Ste14